MIESFLVFNLLLKIKFKKNNENRNKVLKILSDACLGAYLISCMYDKVIYDKLEEYIPVIKQRFTNGKYPARKAYETKFIREGILFQIDAVAFREK